MSGVKQKHITALVDNWHARENNPATMKNRMSVLRWLATQTNSPSLIAKDNHKYGIADRKYVTNISKAKTLDETKLARIKDEHLRMSLRLQAAFGLRREEALKFSPSYADKGDRVALKATWCKGGRAREIPIRNDEQRAGLALSGRFVIMPKRECDDQ